jgi:hypothetical protein
MATADQRKPDEFARLMVMGPSGTGKTGSLLPLILDGYRVRVIDMDNGLGWLVNKLKQSHPEFLKNLDFQTFKDKRKMTLGGPMIVGVPNAYTKAITALDKWDDGSSPQTWGDKDILVIDSLTFLGNAAYDWQNALNPPKQGSGQDSRRIYGLAQDAIADVLDAITSPEFRTHVIVMTHVRWTYVVDDKGNRTVVKGGPSSIGEALTDRIGTYFNTMGLVENIGGKRKITFQSTGLIDLKSEVVNLPPTPLPIETALSTFFKAAKGS